ncbi:MAG: hypothetical protein H0V01_03930 [Bacteroidetes bacterium]|nr:hypothetical protein [Bacteroidota bacterium]HET6243542.1 hypothetical protein [Bacteroidia bacterium]
MKTRALIYLLSSAVLFFTLSGCKKNDDLFLKQEKQSINGHAVITCFEEEEVKDYLLTNNYSDIHLAFNNTCDTAIATTSFHYNTKVFLSDEVITGHEDFFDPEIVLLVTEYLINREYDVVEVNFPTSIDTAIVKTQKPYTTSVFLVGGGIVGSEDSSQ